MAVTGLLLPFPELSGLGAPATDFDAGIGQQVWGLVAAELPVNAACDAASCIPNVPTSPITGITSIDSSIWFEQELTGAQQFPLIDNWFQVPISDLQNGFTFDPALPAALTPAAPPLLDSASTVRASTTQCRGLATHIRCSRGCPSRISSTV
jgi:hypothetical protein